MKNPIRWFEIFVQDMPRAKAFYESVFQIQLQPISTPDSFNTSGMELWGFPASQTEYGSSGALVRAKGVASGGGGTLVYFGSDDCAVEEKRVTQAGGKIERSKFSIGEYGTIVIAVDTEGNRFGIHSMK